MDFAYVAVVAHAHLTYHILFEAQRREPVSAIILTVGSVLLSVWSAIQTDTVVEIQLINRLDENLVQPFWYLTHGNALILPPYRINGGEAVTKIQFQKTTSEY
jgi:hypothetical protein